jgi:hypothetical protein
MLPLAPLIAALALAAPLQPGTDASRAATPPRSAARQDDAAKLRAELILKLLELATWCNDKELFLQRDNVWRSVLALDPENAGARKGLRYSRDAGGNWKEPAPREVKDRNAAALPEFGKKRSEVVGAWRDKLFALLDSQQADAGKRSAAFDEVLQIDPDDAVVRGLRGEARSGEKWVLQETLAGEARRAELRALVQKARAEPPKPEPLAPGPADLALLPAWKASSSSDGMRLLAQTGEAEAKEMQTLTHAGCALLELVCGKPMPPTDGFTVYLVVDPAERDKLLAGIPAASEEEKKIWKASAGFGIPASASVVLWDKDGKRRIDCFARHLVASLLFKGFTIEAKQGWAFEGLGLYLAQQLCGTRMTWFIGSAAGEPAGLRGKLFAPKTDWFAEASRLLSSPKPPKLAELLGKELPAVKLEEMVLAQAFAAYLIEGLPAQLPELLQRTGAGESPSTVLEELTKRPLAETERRLVRWLSERH